MSGSKQLSSALQQAAQLEAQGYGVIHIAEITGLHRATISRHRNTNPKYQQMVREHAQEILKTNPLLLDIVTARQGQISAVVQARECLVEMLYATQDNLPNWEVRKEAAKILLNNPITRSLFEVVDEVDQRSGAPAQTLRIILTNDDEITIEDAELVEDAEDEDE